MAGLESVNRGMELDIRSQAEHESACKPKNSSSNPKIVNDTAAGYALPAEYFEEALLRFENESSLDREASLSMTDKLVRNSLILIRGRELSLAQNLLRAVLMKEPNNPDALKWMGYCLKERGKLEDAAKCFRALVAVRRNEYTLHMLAETCYLLERDEDAFRFFNEALAAVRDGSPILFDIYKCLGNIHVRVGDFEAAEECYNKAYTIRPDSDVLLVNYGTLEIQRDNLESAVQRFRDAVALNPQNDKAWVGLALVHRTMGDMELGWANLECALDINHSNKTALKLAVEWGAIDRDFTVAVRRIKSYLPLHGEDVELSYTLAKILVRLNRLRDAAIEMERVLALEPQIAGGLALMQAIQQQLEKR